MAEFDRIRWAIIVNSLMIVLVAYSILPVLIKFTVTTEYASTLHPLLFYTNWSNILAAVATGCSIYCIRKETRMPKAIAVLKLASIKTTEGSYSRKRLNKAMDNARNSWLSKGGK